MNGTKSTRRLRCSLSSIKALCVESMAFAADDVGVFRLDDLHADLQHVTLVSG